MSNCLRPLPSQPAVIFVVDNRPSCMDNFEPVRAGNFFRIKSQISQLDSLTFMLGAAELATGFDA